MSIRLTEMLPNTKTLREEQKSLLTAENPVPSPSSTASSASSNANDTPRPMFAGSVNVVPHAALDNRYLKPVGNSTLCCAGRCIRATDMIGATTVVLIFLIGFAVIFGYLWWDDDERSWVGVIQMLFVFLTAISMYAAATKDPGIVPKNVGNDDPHRPSPESNSYKVMMIKNVEIKLRYCSTCRIFRPPRSSHCHVCNNCVERFDHHCGVIGACIGKNNVKYFFSFVTFLGVSSAWLLTWTIYFLATKWGYESIIKRVLGLFISALACIVLMYVSTLACYYIKIMGSGYTLREFQKREELYGGAGNPFDNGCRDNCYETWCL